MSGPRHEGWKHTRVIPPDARGYAAAFFPQALKVLGFAQQEAARQGLMTYKHRQQLDDGTVLIGEVVGGLPRMTIDVTIPVSAGRRPRFRDDFVVWARDATRPDGIDPEHPQQVIRPSWTTFFYSESTPGYDDFSGAKGTYRALFPDGIRRAGNLDWIGPDGERVSWYGPSTRYWVDPYVQPRAQFGKFVFLLGQVLLDVDAYIAASDPLPEFAERYVLGAALDGLDLIVVLADLPVESTPAGTVPGNTIIVPSPWTLESVPTTICRFSVTLADQIDPAGRMRVAPGSRVVMWSGDIARGSAPWFFNASVSRAVCLGLPESCTATYSVFSPEPGLVGAPSASSPLWQAEIGDETASVSQSAVSLPAIGAEAVLAADYRGDAPAQIVIRRRSIAGTIEGFALLQAGVEIPLNVEELIAGPNHQLVTSRYVLHADAREGVIVCARIRVESNGGAVVSEDCGIEVWKGGAATEAGAISFAQAQNFGLGRRLVAPDRSFSASTRAVALADQRLGGRAVAEQAVADAGHVGLHLVLGLLVDGQIGDEAQDQRGVVGGGGADMQAHGRVLEVFSHCE